MPTELESNPQSVRVKTPVYEGPLDVLLELIEKRKLLINDISLSQVTDDFIAYVSKAEALPIGETAEFLALAATLLLIKSRSLLPTLELSEDESRDIQELQYRLAVYQIVKAAAHNIGRFGLPMLLGGTAPEREPLFVPDPSVTPSGLRDAARVLLEGFPKHTVLPRAEVKKIMSLEEMITTLSSRISKAFTMSFKEFTRKGSGTPEARHNVIVSFLALLELVKQGIIKATQKGDDIHMESDAVSTPRYGE